MNQLKHYVAPMTTLIFLPNLYFALPHILKNEGILMVEVNFLPPCDIFCHQVSYRVTKSASLK